MSEKARPGQEDPVLNNRQIAAALAEVADLLERQGENPYRVRAYREGADTLRALDRPVHELIREEGVTALRRLPGIGRGLAGAIALLASTGRLMALEELRSQVAPEALLADVPGIGPVLARRIHDKLGISTLEELEQAAHGGQLAEVAGMGDRRVRAVRDLLAARLHRGRRSSERPPVGGDTPPVEALLDVAAEYRRKAAAGQLPRISPRRFNPAGEAWLPVLHTVRGRRRYSALFSNTAVAHRRGTTRDWVVLYVETPTGKNQWTITTNPSGRRIVRGREKECRAYYAAQARSQTKERVSEE